MQITPDYNPTGALKGVGILLLNAQTVDETKSTVVCPGHGIRNHTITLKSSASITGAAVIETSDDPLYAGVWSPVQAAIDVATIGPAAAGELEVSISNRMITALRVRISTVIAGGTLSATYTGQ